MVNTVVANGEREVRTVNFSRLCAFLMAELQLTRDTVPEKRVFFSRHFHCSGTLSLFRLCSIPWKKAVVPQRRKYHVARFPFPLTELIWQWLPYFCTELILTEKNFVASTFLCWHETQFCALIFRELWIDNSLQKYNVAYIRWKESFAGFNKGLPG